MVVRLLRFAGLVSLVGVVACIDVSFGTDGTGGSTSSSSSSGGTSTTTTNVGGSSGVGGSGGGSVTSTTTGGGDCTNKRCGDDGAGGLCNGKPMQPTWGVTVAGDEPRQIIAWPETQSVLVTTSNDRVLRYDECDGQLMAELDGVSAGARPLLLGAGLFGNELRVLGSTNVSGSNHNRLYTLDASQLSSFGAPTETLLNGQFTTKFGGAFADATGIYTNLNSGGLGLVPVMGAECSTSLSANPNLEGRGILHTNAGVFISKWAMSQTIGTVTVCPDACSCPTPITGTGAGILVNALVAGVGDVVSIGVNAMTDARLSHLNPTTLAETGVLDINIDATGQDAMLTGTVWGGTVYAGGATGLGSGTVAYGRDPVGNAVLLSVPVTFNAATVPSKTFLTNGARVRQVAADDSGLYAGGSKAGVGGMTPGFLVKCTPLLACGDIP